MRSINQRDFTFHDNCCRLAAAVHMAFNNIAKDEDIDTGDISTFTLKEHRSPMIQTGAPVKAGVNIIAPYIKQRYNKDSKYRAITMFGKHFNNLLDNGKLIAVPVTISEAYSTDWRNGKKIEGDYSKSKYIGGHWLCVFRKDGKDYILNSRNPQTNIREVDLNTKGLFVGNKAYILY